LFAGSGAVGLEAWSRGAEHVCWVEASKPVLEVLRRNVYRLCDRGTEIVGGDVVKFIRRWTGFPAFDIIFADPPYGGPPAEARRCRVDSRQADHRRKRTLQWLPFLLGLLEDSKLLKPDGLFVMEQGARESLVLSGKWSVLNQKVYGDTRIIVLKRAVLGSV